MSALLRSSGSHTAGGAAHSRPARYALVSIVAGGLAQAGLLLAYAGFGWGTTAASIFSLAVSVGPSYWGSRAFVWQGRGGQREVASFVVVAVLGTGASIVLTALTHSLGQAVTQNRAVLSACVTAGSLLATVVVWLTRYYVLDRVVFAPNAQPERPNGRSGCRSPRTDVSRSHPLPNEELRHAAQPVSSTGSAWPGERPRRLDRAALLQRGGVGRPLRD